MALSADRWGIRVDRLGEVRDRVAVGHLIVRIGFARIGIEQLEGQHGSANDFGAGETVDAIEPADVNAAMDT